MPVLARRPPPSFASHPTVCIMRRMSAQRGDIRERLRTGILIGDGATGTQLHAAGLTPSDCAEEWNVSHPDAVRAVAAAYAGAGADVVLTNTVGGSPLKLASYGLQDRCEELNAAAAHRAREGAGETVFVAGSIGSTGELLEPYGDLAPEAAVEAFARQAAGLVAGGVDAVLVETMISLEEALAAVEAIKQVAPTLPRFVTMTFDASGRTSFGVSPEQAVEALEAAGVDGLGANCGLGSRETLPIIERFLARARVPVIVQPNAGLPQLIGGKTVFPETPEEMAAHARRFAEIGVRWIGGCCGSTPEHIRQAARAVRGA